MVDIEVYPNWQYVLAADPDGRKVFEFEQWQGERPTVSGTMPERFGTFNGTRYDLFVLQAIREGRPPAEVHKVSQDIINMADWQGLGMSGGRRPRYRPKEHVDIFCCVNYGLMGLKRRAANLHFPRFETLPSDPTKPLDPADVQTVKDYCLNDCMATWFCFDAASETIANLASFATRGVPRVFERHPADSAERYWERFAVPPETTDFETTPRVLRTDFSERCPGLAAVQDQLDALPQTVEATSNQNADLLGVPVRIGSGGIHTQEGATVADNVLAADASSYYARLLLALADDGVEHRQIPGLAKQVRDLLDERLSVEKGGKSVADGDRSVAKLILASASGKLNQSRSCLYDERVYLSCTRSGQSLMLDLMARLIDAGAVVYSCNTDGVIADDTPEARQACADWQEATGIPLPPKAVAKYRGRDISNYVAVDHDGKVVKRCGVFLDRSRVKTPSGYVIADALCRSAVECRDWFTALETITETVEAVTEPAPFAIVRQSRAGFSLGDRQLAKITRFYQATTGETLLAAGRHVATSVRLMPDYAAVDMDTIDRGYYIDAAMSLWAQVHNRGPLL